MICRFDNLKRIEQFPFFASPSVRYYSLNASFMGHLVVVKVTTHERQW